MTILCLNIDHRHLGLRLAWKWMYAGHERAHAQDARQDLMNQRSKNILDHMPRGAYKQCKPMQAWSCHEQMQTYDMYSMPMAALRKQTSHFAAWALKWVQEGPNTVGNRVKFRNPSLICTISRERTPRSWQLVASVQAAKIKGAQESHRWWGANYAQAWYGSMYHQQGKKGQVR